MDTLRNDHFPIYDAIATFFSELVSLNESTGAYGLTNATDPVRIFYLSLEMDALTASYRMSSQTMWTIQASQWLS